MWPTECITLDEVMSEAQENFRAHLCFPTPSERRTTFYCDVVSCTLIVTFVEQYLICIGMHAVCEEEILC
jgi:hypothetical protein